MEVASIKDNSNTGKVGTDNDNSQGGGDHQGNGKDNLMVSLKKSVWTGPPSWQKKRMMNAQELARLRRTGGQRMGGQRLLKSTR